MALGARRSNVLLMVLRQGMALTLAGAVLGLLGGFALTRILVSQVYWMKANVPLTCAAATVFLLLTALFAFFLPVH